MVFNDLVDGACVSLRDCSLDRSDVSGASRVGQGAHECEGDQSEPPPPTGETNDLNGRHHQEHDRQGLKQRADHYIVHKLSTENEHPTENTHAGDVAVKRCE